jgi:hypothetical protein
MIWWQWQKCVDQTWQSKKINLPSKDLFCSKAKLVKIYFEWVEEHGFAGLFEVKSFTFRNDDIYQQGISMLRYLLRSLNYAEKEHVVFVIRISWLKIFWHIMSSITYKMTGKDSLKENRLHDTVLSNGGTIWSPGTSSEKQHYLCDSFWWNGF